MNASGDDAKIVPVIPSDLEPLSDALAAVLESRGHTLERSEREAFAIVGEAIDRWMMEDQEAT